LSAHQWNPLQWDAIAQFYPWRVFYARSMRDGIIPLWNPYQFCGTPFLANAQSAVLYPLNVLFVVLDPITAFTVYAALHLFMAAVFMYLLLHELGCGFYGGVIGGVCYAFCTFNVRWLELPTFVGTSVWLPLVLLLTHRAVKRGSLKCAMLAGLVQAVAFFAGHFQIAFYVALAACIWWLWKFGEVWFAGGLMRAVRCVFLYFIAFTVIAVLVASPQVLPTVELAGSSHRVRKVTSEGYQRFVANAVQPYRFITAFVPDFYGNPSQGNYFLGSAADYMEYGLYAGVMPLVMTLAAIVNLGTIRRAGFFIMVGAFAVLIATGTVLNRLFYYLIPGFSALGGPNRILLLYFFAVAVLSGFGAEWMTLGCCGNFSRWRRYEYRRGIMVILAAILLLGILFLRTYLYAVPFIMQLPQSLRDEFFVPGRWLVPFVVLVVASLGLVFARSIGAVGGSVFKLLAAVIVITDLFAAGINYNPTCERFKVYPETALTRVLKRLTSDGSRIAPINPRWSLYLTPKAILPPNAAMIYGIYDVQGYDSLYTRTYKDLSSDVQGEDSSPVENGNIVFIKTVTPQLSRLARYVLTTKPISSNKVPVKLIGRWDGVYVYELTSWRANYSYRPSASFFSFRLGLFLGCLGMAVLAGAFCFQLVLTRFHKKNEQQK
ncbi:MAG: hypothetical protein ACUVT8_03385, partial [Armatimonadota bacterium]